MTDFLGDSPTWASDPSSSGLSTIGNESQRVATIGRINGLDLLCRLSRALVLSHVLASQYSVLCCIATYPGLRASRIADMTGLSPQSVARLLAYLMQVADIQGVKRQGRPPRVFFATAQGVRTLEGAAARAGLDITSFYVEEKKREKGEFEL
jgi:hypothetical protein